MSQPTIVLIDAPLPSESSAQLKQLLNPHPVILYEGLKNYDNQAEILSLAEVMLLHNSAFNRFAEMPALRWLHSPWVGVNRLLDLPSVQEGSFTITNGRGIIANPVADLVLAMMLGWARRMPEQLLAQREGRWSPGDAYRQEVDELAGKTVGIIGYGAIGSAIGKRCKAFEMRVIATRTQPAPAENLDLVLPTSALPELLAQADYVVVTAPLTAQTNQMFRTAQFEQMKPTAFFVNIARGQLVNEAELITALQTGLIAGAGLDVFEQEPLPATSPLWKMSNVILTPHTAGLHKQLYANSIEFFCQNLTRYLAGEPLLNLVNKSKGY